MNIDVIYTCGTCNVRDKRVSVKARTTEDVKTWMDATVRILMRDHALCSPFCRAREFATVKIPINGDLVGGSSTIN